MSFDLTLGKFQYSTALCLHGYKFSWPEICYRNEKYVYEGIINMIPRVPEPNKNKFLLGSGTQGINMITRMEFVMGANKPWPIYICHRRGARCICRRLHT